MSTQRRWQAFGFWLPPTLGHALVVAWASLRVEPYFAPWLVFPLLVGASLGIGLAWLARFCRLADLKLLVAGTLAAGMVCVAMQHWFAYRQAIQRYHQREAALLEKAPLAGAGALALAGERPPTNVYDFLRADAQRGRLLIGGWQATGAASWLSWFLDAMLVAATALAMVWFWRPRLPRSSALDQAIVPAP